MATTSVAALDTKIDPKSSREKAVGDAARELVFGVVGHVGSGTSEVAAQLKEALEDATIDGQPITVEVIKARPLIESWAKGRGHVCPTIAGLKVVEWYQDMGDKMREEKSDHAAIARHFALKIRETRAAKIGHKVAGDEPVIPDGKPRAYILDSIRHPEEVMLLRHVYQDAFVLVGVVCQEHIRLSRLQTHYEESGPESVKALMKRDAKATMKHGQRTADAFHLADFFIDNSVDRLIPYGGQLVSNPDWNIPGQLSRLVQILSHESVVRPVMAETAMHHAYSAQLRSACLSRQVGAALIDVMGNILATGTNEVPRAGGGVYGEGELVPNGGLADDHRCVFRNSKYCSNTREQNEIIADTLDSIEAVVKLDGDKRGKVEQVLRDGRIGALIEFSRAVHAEMDALLSAARASRQIQGSRLFVTTFPCHYCARHIVSAGVDEVQYIEPYPKSAALKLHSDSVQVSWTGWKAPSVGGKQVLFRPFSGVAPRMYRRAFQKTRELKDRTSGDFKIFPPEWASPWHLAKSSYVTLEAKLVD